MLRGGAVILQCPAMVVGIVTSEFEAWGTYYTALAKSISTFLNEETRLFPELRGFLALEPKWDETYMRKS